MAYSQRSVMVGRYAEVSVGGAVSALLFDWTLNVDAKIADASCSGDVWEVETPLRQSWTLIAKGYVVPGYSYIGALFSKTALQTTAVTLACWHGATGIGTKMFEGPATVVKGTMEAPMEMMTQSFELRGNGAPTTIA